MLAAARTFSLIGVEAREVRVEADVRQGLPTFALVGLPDAAVRESRERVRAAIVNSGFEFPQRRITANLAPADLRKAGPGFDLAIAAAILAATEQLPVRRAGRCRARRRARPRRLHPGGPRSDGDGRGGASRGGPGDRRRRRLRPPRRRWSTGSG